MDDAAPAHKTYRLFRVSGAGRVVAVPNTLDARSDVEAVQQARSLAGSQNVELWDGARLVWKSGVAEAR